MAFKGSASEHIWGKSRGFPDGSVRKEFACNAGDRSSIPGSGRSAGEGIGYPLQGGKESDTTEQLSLLCCLGLSTAFLPRSNCLNFTAAVTIHSDSGAQENKICHCFPFSPSICHEVMGPDAMILVF